MHGLYLSKPGTVVWRELPTMATLQDDEVKIKLIYGGICGSDLNVYKGKFAHASYPVVPGHELVGTIIETGAAVQEKIGQRVVVQPNTFCGECEYCRAGKTNICPDKKSLGINRDGGFKETFITSSKYILPIPDALVSEKAILIEPFSVIVHAFKKVKITKKTTIAIIGCGAEGMLSIALASYLGAHVTAIDIKQEKLTRIKQHYKGIQTYLPKEVAGTFDIVIESAGARQSFEQGMNILKPSGSMVLIGMAPKAELSVVEMVRKEQTLYGSIIYHFPVDFQTSVDYLLQEDLNVEPVISAILPVKEYKQAYLDALSGDYGKIILSFEEEKK